MAGPDRHDRLAAALRANLKRRKQPGADEAAVPNGVDPDAGSVPADAADQRQSIKLPK